MKHNKAVLFSDSNNFVSGLLDGTQNIFPYVSTKRLDISVVYLDQWMQALFTKHVPEEGQVLLAIHMWLQLGGQSSQQLIQTYKVKIKHKVQS